jgi:hypothetical protein
MLATLKSLRLPLLLLAIIIYFVTNRYLVSYDLWWLGLVIGGLLALLAVGISLASQKEAKTKQYNAEVTSWNYILVWHLLVIGGLAAYQVYAWSLGDQAAPDSFTQKFLLSLWLTLLVIGGFFGGGVELGFWSSGKGQTAEPQRVRSSGIRWLGIGFFLGFLVCINYVAMKKDQTFDWSYFKTTKPGTATVNVVDGLSEPVEIAAFFSRDSEVTDYVREYLGSLQQESDLLEVQFLDKDFAPMAAERFRASRNGQIVFMKDDKRERIQVGDSLDSARKELKKLDQSVQESLLGLVAEQKTIYLTTGQGEMDWKSSRGHPLRRIRNFERLLRAHNYRVRELALSSGRYSSVPEDADVVGIIGPAYGFSEAVWAMLEQYVTQGGKLLVLLDVEFGGQKQDELSQEDALKTWLESIGIAFQETLLANDRVYLRQTNREIDRAILATNNFSSHESVASLSKNEKRMGLITFQSGYFISENKGDWKVTPTIRSMGSTFNDKNRNFNLDKDNGESRKAYPLAIAAELDKSRVFAFADASFVADPLIRNPGNQLAVADVMKWLAGETQFAGTTETEEDVKIQHSKARDLFVFHVPIYAIPLLVLFAGFLATRRKKGGQS